MSESEKSDDSPSELAQAIDDLGEHFLDHARTVGGYPSQIYGSKRIPGFTFIVHDNGENEPSLEILDDGKFLAQWRKLKDAVDDGEYEDMDEAFLEEGWSEAEVSD